MKRIVVVLCAVLLVAGASMSLAQWGGGGRAVPISPSDILGATVELVSTDTLVAAGVGAYLDLTGSGASANVTPPTSATGIVYAYFCYVMADTAGAISITWTPESKILDKGWVKTTTAAKYQAGAFIGGVAADSLVTTSSFGVVSPYVNSPLFPPLSDSSRVRVYGISDLDTLVVESYRYTVSY